MDKIDKFFLYVLILIVGMGLGQYWRAKQIEPITDMQIESLQRERKEIRGAMISLDTRLKTLERRFKK